MIFALAFLLVPPLSHALFGWTVLVVMQSGIVTGLGLGFLTRRKNMRASNAVVWSLPMTYAIAFVHPVYVVAVLILALPVFWRYEK